MSSLQTPELPAIGLVANLGDDDRAMLSSYGVFVHAQHGETLIRQGDPQNTLYFVVAGLLHARRHDGTRDLLMGRIAEGEWFGEVNIFDPAEASATVVAVQYSQIWKINRESLEQFIQNYPLAANHLVIGIAQVLSKRVRTLGQRLVDEAQFAALMCTLAELDNSSGRE